jgi:hypothetical protein
MRILKARVSLFITLLSANMENTLKGEKSNRFSIPDTGSIKPKNHLSLLSL